MTTFTCSKCKLPTAGAPIDGTGLCGPCYEAAMCASQAAPIGPVPPAGEPGELVAAVLRPKADDRPFELAPANNCVCDSCGAPFHITRPWQVARKLCKGCSPLTETTSEFREGRVGAMAFRCDGCEGVYPGSLNSAVYPGHCENCAKARVFARGTDADRNVALGLAKGGTGGTTRLSSFVSIDLADGANKELKLKPSDFGASAKTLAPLHEVVKDVQTGREFLVAEGVAVTEDSFQPSPGQFIVGDGKGVPTWATLPKGSVPGNPACACCRREAQPHDEERDPGNDLTAWYCQKTGGTVVLCNDCHDFLETSRPGGVQAAAVRQLAKLNYKEFVAVGRLARAEVARKANSHDKVHFDFAVDAITVREPLRQVCNCCGEEPLLNNMLKVISWEGGCLWICERCEGRMLEVIAADDYLRQGMLAAIVERAKGHFTFDDKYNASAVVPCELTPCGPLSVVAGKVRDIVQVSASPVKEADLERALEEARNRVTIVMPFETDGEKLIKTLRAAGWTVEPPK